MIDALLQTPCAHGLVCADHDACCENNPHAPGHLGCTWCHHCPSCHPAADGSPHDCYHRGDPCARCGTLAADRPLPVYGDHRGMCQPPAGA